MLELIYNFIIRSLELIGIAIILLGVAKMLIISGRCFLRRIRYPHLISEIRLILSNYLVLSLEVFIGRDIIETLLDPGMNEFIILAALVLLRTLLAFFLIYEVKKMPAPLLHKKLISR